MEKENTEGLLHPSMLQIRYLTELAKIGKKRGSVALIADTCGVSHGPDKGVPVTEAVQKEFIGLRDEFGLTQFKFPFEK